MLHGWNLLDFVVASMTGCTCVCEWKESGWNGEDARSKGEEGFLNTVQRDGECVAEVKERELAWWSGWEDSLELPVVEKYQRGWKGELYVSVAWRQKHWPRVRKQSWRWQSWGCNLFIYLVCGWQWRAGSIMSTSEEKRIDETEIIILTVNKLVEGWRWSCQAGEKRRKEEKRGALWMWWRRLCSFLEWWRKMQKTGWSALLWIKILILTLHPQKLWNISKNGAKTVI